VQQQQDRTAAVKKKILVPTYNPTQTEQDLWHLQAGGLQAGEAAQSPWPTS